MHALAFVFACCLEPCRIDNLSGKTELKCIASLQGLPNKANASQTVKVTGEVASAL